MTRIKNLVDQALDMSRKARMERAREMGFDREVFHGTREDIDAFDADMSGLGTHVGTLEQAQRRLEHTSAPYRNGPPLRGRYGEGATIMPLRARFKRPLEMEDIGQWNDSATVAVALQNKGIDVPDDLIGEAQDVRRSFGDVEDWIGSLENAEFMGELRGAVQDAGYDSIRYANEVENAFGDVADLTPAARARKTAITAEINAIDAAERARSPAMPDVSSLPEDEISSRLDEWLNAGKVKRYTPEEAARREALLAESMEIERTGRGDPYSYIALDDSQLRSVSAAFDPAKRDSSNLLAGVGGAAVGAGILGAGVAPQEAEAAPFGTLARQLGRRTREAWHGSPHVYDQVDLSRMGTGEGAQAYGAGYYAAERRGLADEYRRQLSRTQRFDGEPYNIDDPRHVAAYWVDHFDGDRDRALRYLEQGNEALRDLGQEVNTGPADVLRRGERLPDVTTPEGALYRLEIPDENLLDWDAPLSEQPEAIRDAVLDTARAAKADAANPMDIDLDAVPGMTGGQAYDHIKRVYGNQASVELGAKGIPGIRYLDGASRNAGEGTRNYVIFDDRNVNVVERNGEPVAAMPRGREEPMSAAAGFARPGAMAATGAAGALASFLDMRSGKQDTPYKRFIAQGQRAVEQAIGAGENIGNLAASLLAEPIAGYAGLVAGPEAVERTRDYFAPQSMSPAAQQQMIGLGNTLESAGQQIMSGLDVAGQAVGVDRLSDYARYAPGYWEQRVVPALQRQFGTRAGSALAAMLRAAPEAL